MAIASIIQILVAHDVEFVVVGGMAAVLQGAPVHPIDLNIVYARCRNRTIARLQLALSELGAVFRDDPRRIGPNHSHLQATIETSTTFEDLLPDSEWLEVDGARFRVLSLSRLIFVEPSVGTTGAEA